VHRSFTLAAALTAAAVLVVACSDTTDTAAPAAGDTTAASSSTAASTTLIPQTTVALSTTTTVAALPKRPGVTTVHLKYGPFDIQPGQNNIDSKTSIPQPEMNGWIVGIRPDLRFEDGTVPPVDVVHLHHGVWLNLKNRDLTSPLPERFFAAGEEKTSMLLPAPYGYRYQTSDHWILNYMLHNLTPENKKVWVTYDIDIIPDTAPEASGMIPAHPVWMDVQNGSIYPVFDALRGAGDGVTYTYPDQATDPYKGGPALNTWTADRDGVLIATGGHLHPGGLHTDLYVTRDGKKAHLFESEAKYYEPAGAVSWDVAMTVTNPDWHVQIKKGDVLSTTATYDSGLASWYESMGIMVTWMGETGGTADDPFTTKVDGPGMLTHGHLAENDHHGGQPDAQYLDLTKLPSEPAKPTVEITDWIYGQGDMNYATAVPTVRPGGTFTFDNKDAPIGVGQWHTITACKAPCNQSTGIAYPLADGPVIFDSGELGLGGPPTANRTTWSIPADLPDGTYTYFCRIHPLMRGAFRVEG
jgi:plastocyanin